MYTEASPDPERCGFKIDAKTKNNRASIYIKQKDQFEDVNIPYTNPGAD